MALYHSIPTSLHYLPTTRRYSPMLKLELPQNALKISHSKASIRFTLHLLCRVHRASQYRLDKTTDIWHVSNIVSEMKCVLNNKT